MALEVSEGVFSNVTVPTVTPDEQLHLLLHVTRELWVMNSALIVGQRNMGRYEEHVAELFNFVQRLTPDLHPPIRASST